MLGRSWGDDGVHGAAGTQSGKRDWSSLLSVTSLSVSLIGPTQSNGTSSDGGGEPIGGGGSSGVCGRAGRISNVLAVSAVCSGSPVDECCIAKPMVLSVLM